MRQIPVKPLPAQVRWRTAQRLTTLPEHDLARQVQSSVEVKYSFPPKCGERSASEPKR